MAPLTQHGAHRRMTNQRQIISECLQTLNHPTVEEIQECVMQTAPSINKTTTYRTMNRMVEDGEVRRLVGEDGTYRYDPILEKHYHIYCEKCGTLSDVDMPVLPQIDEHFPKENKFQLTGHEIVFRGICPKCQEKAKQKAIE